MTDAPSLPLPEFLSARIAEDGGRLVHDSDCDRFEVYDYGTRYGTCDCRATQQLMAECEAKRQILRLHGAPMLVDVRNVGPTIFCDICDDGFPCATLKWLTLPYADHPDYRLEWHP